MKPDDAVLHMKVTGALGQQVSTECVNCTRLSGGLYRLSHTPTMVQGVARGDVVEVLDNLTGDFRVITRGGQLAVQVFCKGAQATLSEQLRALTLLHSGYFDSYDERQIAPGTVTVITISLPVSLGFPKVETILDRVVNDVAGAEWYFGNVYEPADGVTPLNWWVTG